jgi:PAS domain S-box-containing protein
MIPVPASEEKYRRLFETAQDGILLLDAETGVISDANPFVEELLGYPPDELIGKKFWETAPFKDVSASRTAFLKLQKESHFRFENLPLETKDGRYRNVDFISNVYQVDSQKIVHCNIRDITERRQVENALAESMRRYQELFDNAGLGIFQTAADGRIIAVNPEFAHMLGYQSPEELVSLVRDAAAVFADPQRRAEIIRLKAENPGLMRLENLYRRKDGSTFFGSLTLRQVTGPDDQAVFEGLVEDITERKQVEELLRENEARYRNIFEGVQDAIFVETPDGQILDVNQCACEMFGYTRAQFLGKKVADLVPSEKYIVPFRVEDSPVIPDHPVETINVRANGEEFSIEISTRVQELNDATVLFVVGRDITERKRAEAALRRRMEQLVSLSQASQAVITSLDLDQVLAEILSLAGKVVGSDFTSVLLVDEAGHISRGMENVPGVLSIKRYVRKKGFTSWILGTHVPVVVDDISDAGVVRPRMGEGAPQIANPHLVAQGIKSFAGLPLIVEERIVGVLYLYSLQPGTFREQLSLLNTFANQVAITIEKAHLYDAVQKELAERQQAEVELARQTEELRRRNDELARLYRAFGSLISGASLSLQELGQSIVAVVQQEFGQANCSLLVISRDSNELHRLAAAGPYTGQMKNNQMVTLDGPGLIPLAIRTGAKVNVGNVRSSPDYVANWEAARSELTIPLKVGNKVIGVIDVQSSDQDAFSPDDERLMSVFAERAALVLEHARLNTQTEARMQQLLALRTVDMAISSSFDVTMTLGILLDQITRLAGVHAVDILAFNANTQTFQFSCERGFRTQTLQHTQIRFGAGYAWRAVRERQMVVVPDLQAEADGLQRSPDLSSEQFIAYVGIPLLAKGQVKGVLEIFHREPLILEAESYAFLEMLAGQAAIAIDNSELFDRLQSSNAELGMAYDSTLEGWANALELRDKETEGHTRRVAELATRLAQAMGVRDNDMLQIYRGALLHDIGKMGVPDSIVLKPGPLNDDEWTIMRKHPQYAYDMLSPIAYLRTALDIPYCHHEKWDGTGYPRGLRGGQIPMAARIFAVVDVWDALTSDRPYRKAWQEEKALQYIQEQAGRYFDPEVVKAFLAPSFKQE